MTIIPVYNVAVVPEANLYLMTENYKSITGKDPEKDEKVVFIVLKEKLQKSEFREDSFYHIGVSGVITGVNSNGYISIRTSGRLNIDELNINPDQSISLTVSKRPDIDDLDKADEGTRLKKLTSAMTEYISHFQWGLVAGQVIARWTSFNEAVGAMSYWLLSTPEEKYALLAEDSNAKRAEMEEKMLYEYIESARVSTEAADAQEKDYQKIYRESAIKKQIEYLQKQLDEMHPEDVSEERKLELKIQNSGMNKDAKKEAEKVLNRMKQEGQQSQEYGMLHDWLDFVTSLSWKKPKFHTTDIKHAREILDRDHSGLDKVKKRIIQQIAVMNLTKKQSGSILLFVGAPGTGKTSIGKSIADALGRKYVRVSLGGVRDEADIRGHRRTYIGAMPGRIMDGIAKSGSSCPVMVLDEVDKLSSSYNGDPASALLEVLDPEQNNTFTDHYMNVPYDLSNVFFICTANSTDTIPEPLLNRMEVIDFTGYTPVEKLEIAKKHLLPQALKKCGLKEEDIEISDDVLKEIISSYTLEAGVRGLRKRLDTLCRTAAVKRAENPDVPFKIESDNLRELLDMHPITHDKINEEGKPGIVTGLAWTRAGGEILFIESLFTKGNGKITVTGQLGDVMKESVSIAISLAKSIFPEKVEMFEENDLHIHVPEGAVQKDGPSAGITITTAICSLLNGKVPDPKTAMTGEVSLRGNVMPIGGLPEKLLAAQRAGVKRVLIPKDNVPDLDDVAETVKNELEIVPVTTVREVLKLMNITE